LHWWRNSPSGAIARRARLGGSRNGDTNEPEHEQHQAQPSARHARDDKDRKTRLQTNLVNSRGIGLGAAGWTSRASPDSSIRTRAVDLFRGALVLALQTAFARDIDGGAQHLGNETSRLAMVRGIPVHGLMFKLVQRCRPAGATERWR
jgi:hypothetical protein